MVPVDSLARKPLSMTFEEAAGVPIAGETAYRALHEVAQVKPGQTVLIHGAAGGVGSAGVQIAKAAGARVIGTASASNADFLRSLGAQQAIDYRTQKFEDVVGKVDVVFNTANKETNDRSIAVVREGGMLVSIVGMPDSIACGVAKIRCATPIRNGPTNAELLARVGELADAVAQQVERADDLALVAKGHCHLRPHAGHELVVPRVQAHVLDDDRALVRDGGADHALPDLQAEVADDLVRVAHRVGDVQVLALLVDEVDGEHGELRQAGDELRDLLQQLVQFEHRGDLAAQLGEDGQFGRIADGEQA